jgi:DNA-binding transcriptional regulator YdaS (Cro superfamily)
MSDPCETCQSWTGRICENEDSQHRNRLVGARWTCPEHRFRFALIGFAEFLEKTYPVRGCTWGGRRHLAQHLGVSDMCVCHWIRGVTSPGPERVPRIAEFVGRSPEEVEAMILVDVRRRAERTWRDKKD